MNKKGFAPLVLVFVVGGVLLVIGTGWYYSNPFFRENNILTTKEEGRGTEEWGSIAHTNSGIILRYPKEWKLDVNKNYFTTSDYKEGVSGARIELIYGLGGADWQKTIATMYGSKSENQIVRLHEKEMLKTTYPNNPHLVGLSLPFAGQTRFASLLLEYETPGRLEASYKDSYEPILEFMASNMTLPATQSTSWQEYNNATYYFSLSHPPFTSVANSHDSFKNSVTSFLVTERYGFHQPFYVFKKIPEQTLRDWYDQTFKNMPTTRTPVEKTINRNAAIDIAFQVMEGSTRHIFIGKNDTVIDFTFDNDNPLTPDQEKLINSLVISYDIKNQTNPWMNVK